MPWKETCQMDERMRFVVACVAGVENLSELCRQFGISRKTGYKWLMRHAQSGAAGLSDRSRAPHGNARAVPSEIVESVLAVRQRYPSWGPRKVRSYLQRTRPDLGWPAASTIGNLFDAHGLTRPRKQRRRTPVQTRPFARVEAPNDTWCMDFKGWFLTGDGIRVDPLTITDAHSRYLLGCEAVARMDTAHVWPVLERLFRDYGLPMVMRSDNGAPFAGRGAAGLSRLAVRLIKAGVLPERIQPGRPQQNGRHERFHLTLLQDTASPPARTLREQLHRFTAFRSVYNDERPHEALGQVPPGEVYRVSSRRYSGVLASPDYPAGCVVRRVRTTGSIKWQGEHVFVSEVLAGEPVGLLAIAEETWLVKYGPVVLGTIKGRGGLVRVAAPKARSGSPKERRACPSPPPSPA